MATMTIAEYDGGKHVGARCKYCERLATTVHAAGRGKAHESMAFCDDCKPSVDMTATEWTLWGYWPGVYVEVPIRLTAGTLPHCRKESETRRGEGWPELKIAKLGADRPWFSCDPL